MNHVERFRAVMNYRSVDRLPMWEWAMWWDKTIERWRGEGLPGECQGIFEISQYFGLDPYYQLWISTTESTIEAAQHHVEGIVANMDDYERIRPRLYPPHEQAIASIERFSAMQARGEVVVWATFEGFFWFPRTLMNIERQMLAFYDQPELIHRINEDLLQYHFRILEKISRACVPTFMTFAEDMSYNHGPMLSRAAFDQFMAPYYRRLIPRLQELSIIPIVDTDGDVTALVPWLEDVGIAGVLPLERQAGVDGVKLRQQYPKLRMIGHYDKLVMDKGESAMRAEFERLGPIMKSGGFIPSVDHQTHPGVSLEEYRLYLRLLREYVKC